MIIHIGSRPLFYGLEDIEIIDLNILILLNSLLYSLTNSLKFLKTATKSEHLFESAVRPMFLRIAWQTDSLYCNTYTVDIDLIGKQCEWMPYVQICSFDLRFIGVYR